MANRNRKSRRRRVQSTPDEVLFIFGVAQPAGEAAVLAADGVEARMKEGERSILSHLEELGYRVETTDDTSLQPHHTNGKALVIVSSTVRAERVGMALRLAEIPVIVSSGALFAALGLTGAVAGRDYGTVTHDATVRIRDASHPMAAGLTGTTTLSEVAPASPFTKPGEEAVEKAQQIIERLTSGERRLWGEESPAEDVPESASVLVWGIPREGAIKIAALENLDERALIFGYDLCGSMFGLQAPARRVGLFLNEAVATKLTGAGWALFDAAVNWAIGDEAKDFTQVYREEWLEIHQRRSRACPQSRLKTGNVCQPPRNLVGLALSGGGIRSATFCLGLLQGLKELELLYIFDYLSTVSGGGYLGGWWSAWLSRMDREGRGIFPAPEKIELDRARRCLLGDRAKSASDDVDEERDSIHHLRLFANYLTPRKGLLSADTWRAIAVITRNLVLTWLILVPILVAFVLAGQLYFTLQPRSFYEYRFPYWSELARMSDQLETTKNELKLEREKKYPVNTAEATSRELQLLATLKRQTEEANKLKEVRDYYFRKRLKTALLPILPLVGWIIYMTGIWMMRNTSGSRKLGWTGGFAVLLLLLLAIKVYGRDWVNALWNSLRSDHLTQIIVIGWGLVALLLWFYATRMGQRLEDPSGTTGEERTQVQLNRIMLVHVRLLVLLVVTASVLALAGFGHELVGYIFQPHNPLLVQAGGWTAIASAIAGSIFTAVKSSPMGGGDPRASSTPSLPSRIIFAITPPLVLLVLALAAAWLARLSLYYVIDTYQDSIPTLTLACFAAVALWLIFAAAEINWRRVQSPLQLAFVCAAVIMVGILEHLLLSHGIIGAHTRILPLVVVSLASGFILFRLAVAERVEARNDEQRVFEFAVFKQRFKGYGITARGLVLWSIALAVLIGGCIVAGVWLFNPAGLSSLTKKIPPNRITTDCVALTGLLLCIVLILFEVWRGMRRNRRALWLFMAAYLVLTALLITSFFDNYELYKMVLLAHAAVGLLGVVFGWVVALGWMADPNALSMHTFYKGRLVRAYMGASNPVRHEQGAEITDAVERDDLLLKALQNCQRGAPYHLINTTLNLVGGRDLTTAQRSSAAFVLSRRYCGSSRTGYRKTEKYMDGKLSLGAAIAASGAAVSPNMGSLRTSASLAVLLTFLNVRLGYWAPTPNKDNWRSSQTRLWPFYMLRESLSQTNDLSTYCYLTDGGHFENTALYSLVERGCRFIVMSDSAADPTPCFADLGNAIRRCRIDFKTEIQLDITPFIKKSREDRFSTAHYAVGQIKYSKEHLEKLGWVDPDPEDFKGIIVYIKPSVLERESNLTVDVRQYEIENAGFPQQTTVDQWFDEAQFESYRQLGYHCVKAALDNFDAACRKLDEKLLRKESLQPDEELALKAREAHQKVKQREFSPDDVQTLFKFFESYSSGRG